MLIGTRRALLGGGRLRPFDFDLALATFTARMDKRLAPGPFATAPIVQGDFDGTGDGDYTRMVRGNLIHEYFYANNDPYQGSIVFWITPEWDGDDGIRHEIYNTGEMNIQKAVGDIIFLQLKDGGGWTSMGIDCSAWTAGTTYCVVARWDSKNTLDGTNYCCISINGAHAFGKPTSITVGAPDSTNYIGCRDGGGINQSDAIIEGFTIYRRPLFDGTYGVDAGNGDEINRIWAAGAGVKPEEVTGGEDIVFQLPTNGVAEELVTGTGEAHSFPNSDNVVEHGWLEDGGYLGDEYGVAFNGADTEINCGSGITLDDLPLADFTAEGWARWDGVDEEFPKLMDKRAGNNGWYIGFIGATAQLRCVLNYATTDAVCNSSSNPAIGKWFHWALVFDVGTLTLTFYLNGVDVTTDLAVGVGAYQTDAALDLRLGASDGQGCLFGALGWNRLSDNKRYTANFIPPRQMPGADGNTVEQWAMNEGTGAVITAVVTVPGNNGTLANGTWEEQWDQEGSPVIPYTVECDGDATDINCGSAVIIDDLPTADFTAEGWARRDGVDEEWATLMRKWSSGGGGWIVSFTAATARLYFSADFATDDAYGRWSVEPSLGKWFHWAVVFDVATKTPTCYLNGVDVTDGGSLTSGVGAYQADGAHNLYLSYASNSFLGALGWSRISDNHRYTDTFVPPSRLNPPGVDGNTIAQWNFRDGAGTTLLDETVNNVDGTITSGIWRLTPDAEIDSPGQRVYQWGYTFGNDAINEGMYQQQSGLAAGQDYVARLPIRYEGVRAQPQIIAYDATNGAAISTFLGPKLTGLHSGGNGSATLIVATGAFPQSLVGAELYNITDGSSTTITAVSGDMTTITGVLAGGTDNLWDTNDVFMIMVADEWVWDESFTFELPTMARHGVGADCVELHFKCLNVADEGVLYWEQVQLIENEIDNPSMEATYVDGGAGGFLMVAPGWGQSACEDDGTDLLSKDAGIFHSGAASQKVDVDLSGEGIVTSGNVFATGKWYLVTVWLYSAADNIQVMNGGGTFLSNVVTPGAAWVRYSWVVLATGNDTLLLRASGGAAVFYIDDVSIVELDDVALTVTPANQANSMEGAGIRVDGRDGLPQPIPVGKLFATKGRIRWRITPRHDAADAVSFGNATPFASIFWFDATHYFQVVSTAGIVTLTIDDGGGAVANAWNPATLNAGVGYLLEIKYNAAQCELIVDGMTRATVVTPIDFGASIPNWAYWLTNQTQTQQIDAVIAAP